MTSPLSSLLYSRLSKSFDEVAAAEFSIVDFHDRLDGVLPWRRRQYRKPARNPGFHTEPSSISSNLSMSAMSETAMDATESPKATNLFEELQFGSVDDLRNLGQVTEANSGKFGMQNILEK